MSVDRARKDAAEARELPAKLPAAYLGQNMEYAHPGTGHWMGKARTMLATLADHVDVLVSELEAAQKERDEAIEALQLALDGIPDPMHPGIPPKFVDKLVAAQVVLMDAVGHDDPGNVAEARRVLASAATPTPTKENA